jgi:hypothetical protein
VSPRAGLDAVAKRKNPCPFREPKVGCPARSKNEKKENIKMREHKLVRKLRWKENMGVRRDNCEVVGRKAGSIFRRGSATARTDCRDPSRLLSNG